MKSYFSGGMNAAQINKLVKDCLTLAVNNPGTHVGKYAVFRNRDDPSAKIIVLSFVDMMTEICSLYSKCSVIDVKGASGRSAGVYHFCPNGCRVEVDGKTVKLSNYKIAEVDDLTTAFNPESIKTWSESNQYLLAGYFPIVSQSNNVFQDLKTKSLIVSTKSDTAFSDAVVPIVKELNTALESRKTVMENETAVVVQKIKEIDTQELVLSNPSSSPAEKKIAEEKVESLQLDAVVAIATMVENTNTIESDVDNSLVLLSGKPIDTDGLSPLQIEALPKASPTAPNTVVLEEVQSNDKSVKPVAFDAPEVKEKLDEVAQNIADLELEKSNIIINSEIDKAAAISQAVAKTPAEKKLNAKYAERMKRRLVALRETAAQVLEPVEDKSGAQNGGGFSELGEFVRNSLLAKLVAVRKYLRENEEKVDIPTTKRSSSGKLSKKSSGRSRSGFSGRSRSGSSGRGR